MYDEDKQGDIVENVNAEYENNEVDKIKQENETLRKMVETRDAELNKPKEITEDKISILSNALGINKINERLDELNKNDNYLVTEMGKIVNAINQLGQTLQGGQVISQGETPQIGDPVQKMELLSNLFDKGLQLYQTFKQNQAPPASTIPQLDPNWIMTEAIEAVKDDFSLGKDLRSAIKNSIKQKTVNSIIKGVVHSNIDNDEPA